MITIRMHLLAAASGIALAAAPAAAQGQTPVHFSVVGGLSFPLGDLGNSTDLGLNLAVRGEGRPVAPGWSVRGDMSYDRYDGRGAVNTYSYLGFAGNLIHRTRNSRTYQFGGLGLYNSRIGLRNAGDRSDIDLGMQLGAGYDVTRDQRVFAEFGLTSAFTSGRSSLWFPLRIGMRF